jgi:hypothetical protein
MRAPIFIALISAFTASCSLTPLSSQYPVNTAPTVDGFIYAHWEYPIFLFNTGEGQQAMPFDFKMDAISAARYRDVIFAHSTSRTIAPCLHITGKGFVARRKPTSMWPARSQFVFTQVSSLEELSSRDACEARLS